MSGLPKWKVALYLAGIFLAGGVSGWVVAAKTAKENAFKPPQPREIATSFRDRLNSKLNLTPEQAQQIDVIIQRTTVELQAIHGDNVKRIKQGVSNRHAQISAILTPEQHAQFCKIEKERDDAWRGTNSWRGKRPERDGHRGPPRDKGATDSVPRTN